MNLNAKVIRNLIQDVMHNPIFNPANIDHYMHDRLVRSVMDDTDVHDMKMEGNGEQDNIHFFFATRFTVFATFFKFSPHPSILSPHTPILSPHPPIFSSVLYSEPTQAVRLKSRPPRPARHATPPPENIGGCGENIGRGGKNLEKVAKTVNQVAKKIKFIPATERDSG